MTRHRLAMPTNASARYPEQPFGFLHGVPNEGLLSVDALMEAADELPEGMVEFTCGGPTRSASKRIVRTTLRAIASSEAWFIFRNLEQLPRYEQLMRDLLEQVCEVAPWVAGTVLRPMCFAFLSSPRVETPLHIDPEHNFLFQISGRKNVFVNDPLVAPVLPDEAIRDFFGDEIGYRLDHTSDYEGALERFVLVAGAGLYIPVVAPHFVVNGEDVSVSLSITYQTERSEAHRARYR